MAASSLKVHEGALQKIDDTLNKNCTRAKQKLTSEYLGISQWLQEAINGIKDRFSSSLAAQVKKMDQ